MEGNHLHADEPALVVLAHRAHGGSPGTLDDHAAVEAHPLHLDIGDKELFRLQQVGEPAEAVAVDLLDVGDHVKGLGDLGKALLPGHVGKVGVVVLPLLVLVVLGGAQMLQHAGEDVHRVSAVDLDVLAGEGLQ